MSFKPSQVVLDVPPLPGTFGKSELEHAAAIIVRVSQALGDVWQPATWKQVQSVLRTDATNGTLPFGGENGGLLANPFFRPDVYGLVEGGFARDVGEGGEKAFELTPAGIARLERWVRR